MYKILSGKGVLMGYAERVNYICLREKSILPCSPVEGRGINYKGEIYNLPGWNEWPDRPTAYPSMVTDAELATQMGLLNANVYLSRKQARALEDDEERLHVTVLYDDWAPGSHEVGEIYNTHQGGSLGSEWEQTWECVQAYDNAVYPDLRPGDPSWYTFNRPLHGKSPETARPWVQPTHGTVDIYRVGEYMVWTDGDIYTPTRDTNYSPEEYAPDWTNWTAQQGGGNAKPEPEEPEPEDPDPEEPEEPSQYPAWEDMETGTALHVGDHFTYQGAVYEVLRDMTVTPGWEPPALLNDYYEEVTA